MAGVPQSPLGSFDDILSEQILMADNQCLECGVELMAVSQDPETTLQVRTDDEFGQRLDRPVSFDHLTRSRRGNADLPLV